MNADVRKAVFGWSNVRTGCEVYEHPDDLAGEWPRWTDRGVEGGVGALLSKALGDPEGSAAVVVTLPGRLSDRIDDVAAAVAAAVEAL